MATKKQVINEPKTKGVIKEPLKKNIIKDTTTKKAILTGNKKQSKNLLTEKKKPKS